MGTIINKISEVLKSEETKDAEKRIEKYLIQAEKLIDSYPKIGLIYLNCADETYYKLEKGNEELRARIDSLGSKYINGG